MALEVLEEKWIRHTRRARNVWLSMVKRAESLEAYCKGIAAVTGIPEATIRASFPAKNWADFQANAERYVDIWIGKVEAAYRARKWSSKYRQAFQTAG
jgi:hypothetical protein